MRYGYKERTMKKYLLILCALIFTLTGFSQDIKIGVRTGLSFYKLSGPLETNETQSLASGFVFGITGQYNITESFGVRTELSYVQKSSQQEYTERFFTIIKPDLGSAGVRSVLYGGDRYTLEKRFNVFSIPLHAVYRPTRKIEIFGGVDIDFTAGTIGEGNMSFRNNEFDTEISYIQALNYNYSNNLAQEFFAPSASFNLIIDFDLDQDGVAEKVNVPKTIPAYYYFDYDEDENFKTFKTFDVALAAGASYYINPGLYIRAKINYGLRDTTFEEFDYSLQDVNDDATFIFRDDYDRKIGGQISLGFQF